MRLYRKFIQKNVVGSIICISCVFVLASGCSPRKKPDTVPQLPSMQTEPTVIELDSSKLSDALQEGDIPEENRGDLPWLPNRPPRGTQFQETSALQSVYFEFDKYSLTSEARNILNNNVVWLRNNPDVLVQIEGHCDERGTLEYNEVLGENRAIGVKKYLVTLGIDPDRLYTISYGETMPADPQHNEEAWAKNRRAQFKTAR